MASTPESRRTIHDSDSEIGSGSAASRFQKTVCLHDWWLVRAESDFNGKRLAVAGLTSRPDQPVRIFSSAPILKRYDIFTLETVDGICVVIKGFINKMRTTDNGFPAEVFKHFVFGFPPNWETYAANCFEGEAFDSATMENVSDTDKLLRKSKNAGMNDHTPINMNSPLCKNSPSKDGKEKVNVTPSNFGSKSSDRLRNLKNNQKNPSCKNLDAKWKKERKIIGGSNTERSKINSAPACSNGVSNLVHDCTLDSQGEISNLCDGEPSLSMHGNLANKQDGCVEDGNPLDARQGLNHGDAIAQYVMQSMNVTKTAVSFTGVDILDEKIENKRKEEKASWKKARRKILFDAPGSPITRQGKEKNSIISPECLSYGRSRSGRLLLPTMEFWRNQLPVYDADHGIRGIQEGLPLIDPPREMENEGGNAEPLIFDIPSYFFKGWFHVPGSKTEPRRKR